MPSHDSYGPEDHSLSFETEDLKDSEPGKPNTGPGTEEGEKKNGTPSDSLDNDRVSPSLMKNPAEIPDGWKEEQPSIPDGRKTDKDNSDYLPSILEPIKSNTVKGGPCHHIGVGAPLQKINTRARVLTDREREKIRRERSLKREKSELQTSLS